MTRHPGKQLKDLVWRQQLDQVQTRTWSLVRPRMLTSARDQVYDEVLIQVRIQVRYRVRYRVRAQLREELKHDQTSR